ncbi:MAG: biopolymer transporter ExbD, partial [Pirellulales bacterium]
MKVVNKKSNEIMEADLTPMIDMVFQLIAFFMVLVNFSQAEQDARVLLPKSAMAIPPEETSEAPLTIQLAKLKNSNEFRALVSGDEVQVGQELDGVLSRERRQLGLNNRPAASVTVVIRAHKDVPTGSVQEVIENCQKHQFEKFRLR